ncbi:hypothetical protein CBE79_16875 [Priestia megaterium]|nr:hypothetical protein D0440_06880 [Priestia megaterium]TPF16566.1 hypothetical protein CBE78_09745 [Priestia megaterium]TPF24459.1 hypothetical protein CBE79_16875 [Priestia megaterium]
MKENPNDESRFLMENPTRSDFFIGMVNVGFIYILAHSLFKKANKIGDFKPNDKKIGVVCQRVVEIDSFFGMCKKNRDKKTDRMLQTKLASFLHKK